MRLSFLILLTLCVTVGARSAAFFSHRTHPNYYDDITENEPLHKRFKRAIYSAIGLTSTCDPGWTGQFCENPICSKSAPAPSDSINHMRQIDTILMGNGCTGKYYVPFDGTSNYVFIQVTTTSGSCSITVSDASGSVINGTGGVYEGGCYTQYINYVPGAYQLTVNPDAGLATGCVARIEAFTSLNVDQGFSLSPQSDDMPHQESAIEGTPMYFVAHIANLTTPGYVKTVTIRDDSTGNITFRAILNTRFNCAYELYAGQFVCTRNKIYTWNVDGIDNTGSAFRRSSVFTCVEAPPTPPPPTPAPITACLNGGTILRPGTTNASCFCPELFTGDTCQTANCMNGGTLNPQTGITCICPDGFYGTNCEHVTCEPNYSQYLTDKKSLIVVVRNTVSMKSYKDSIVAAIRDAVENSPVDKSVVYTDYVLVSFSNGNYRSVPYGNYANFLGDLQDLSLSDIGNCTDVTFDGIYSVFEDLVTEHSPIFLITDAYASDIANWRTVTEANSRRKLPIYTMVLPQSGCNWEPMDLGYVAISNAASYSGGLNFLPGNATVLQSVLRLSITTTTYSMNQILADDMIRCTTNGYRTFLVDSSATDLFIIATGKNVIISMTDPNWKTDSLLPIYSDSYNYFYEVPNVVPGEYLLNVISVDQSTPCSLRVVSRSNYDLFFATTDFAFVDAIDSEPVVGNAVHLVAQLNGLVNATRDPYRLFAELTITSNINNDNNQYQKPMYYSSGKYRDGCGYHLYFGVANFCEFPDQQFYATVFADDNNGYTIQRTSIGYCSLIPTTVSPPGDCQNGGVMVNGSCVCRVGYQGQYCESIICQNGGTPAGSYCACIPGTGGFFCELYSCTMTNPSPSPNFERQSMVWVVSTKQTMQDTWKQLAAGVNDFIRDSQYISNTWITTWVLVTVNQDGSNVAIKTDHPQDFVSSIVQISQNFTQYTSTNTSCGIPIEEAMYTGILYSTPGSSVYVFADSDGPDSQEFYLPIYLQSTQYRITLNLLIPGEMCTYSGDGTFPALQDLIYNSNGFIYTTTQIQGFLNYINTMYRSQMVGGVGQADCTTGYTGYFAVDSAANSLSIAVTGGNVTSITVYGPDGTKDPSSQIKFVKDTYLDAYVYLPNCPAGWQGIRNQTCYYFGSELFSWDSASLLCHSKQGSLIDVYNDDKQKYIYSQTRNMDSWIGLRRNGASWIWDVPDGNHYSTLENHYTNWCPGFPTADSTQNCVYTTSDNCWKNANCSEQRPMICQTMRYDPSAPGENTVSPGRWRIDITTSIGGCMAQIRSQSQLMVNFGFVQDPTADFPDMNPNSASSSNYIIAHTDGLLGITSDVYQTMEGRLNYALLGYNNTLTNALPLNERWFCGYEMISPAFSCPNNGGGFFIKFSGIDPSGYAFERYVDAVCKTLDPTCLNGGFANNGVCVCPAGYTGSRCSTPICQNEGTAVDGKCVCQGGFSGALCDMPLCEPPYPAKFQDNGKTLAILLETSYNMGNTIFQLKKNLKASLDKIKSDPSTASWFSNYILYPFDSTSNKDIWYPITVSSNSDDIVNAVNNIPLMTCPGGNCSDFCPRPIMQVLKNTLNHPNFTSPNSVILVVTRSSAEDYESLRNIVQPLQESRAQVNFVLTAIDSPCGEGWNTSAASAMYYATQYADGNIFTMSSVDFTVNFLQQYLPSLYSSAGISAYQNNDCGYGEMIFQVENEMSEFTIDFITTQTFPKPSYLLLDPNGDVVTLPANLIATSDSNYLGVIPVDPTLIGTYRFVVSGNHNTFCAINVRGRSSIEIYPAFVNSNADMYNGITRDDAYYSPEFFANNTLVVHASGLTSGAKLTYAQIVEPGFGLVYSTTLFRRDSACSYEWYAPTSYYCTVPSLLTIVYGVDSNGANFKRMYTTTCIDNVPAPKPPPAHCDLTAANQDTLFIIDSSSGLGLSNFNTLTQFAASAMSPYKLSSSNTQVAAISLASSAQKGFDYFASSSWNDLNNQFKNLQFIGTSGQNLSSAVDLAINYYSEADNGYRANSRHLVVYVTGTVPSESDPLQSLYGMRRSGVYGFAVVAFNMGTSNPVIDSLASGGCIYYSPDSNDLNNYAVNFIQQLTCSRYPRCGM